MRSEGSDPSDIAIVESMLLPQVSCVTHGVTIGAAVGGALSAAVDASLCTDTLGWAWIQVDQAAGAGLGLGAGATYRGGDVMVTGPRMNNSSHVFSVAGDTNAVGGALSGVSAESSSYRDRIVEGYGLGIGAVVTFGGKFGIKPAFFKNQTYAFQVLSKEARDLPRVADPTDPEPRTSESYQQVFGLFSTSAFQRITDAALNEVRKAYESAQNN
jgi:hypothetical protein